MSVLSPSSCCAARPVLLIRADAGGAVGAGHVMRMLALAQAWIERGGAAHLASITCPVPLIARLTCEGVRHHMIDADVPGSAEDSMQTVRLGHACGASWIVLDGYRQGFAAQNALHAAGFTVMAVDDYGHTDLWCADLVLNQNFGATEQRYVHHIASAVSLVGPRFALLRREFRAADHTVHAPNIPPRRLVLTLGGVDEDNVTGAVLAALAGAASQPLDCRVLLGAGNPHEAALAAQVRALPLRVEFVRDCRDMPAMYCWADAVISAAGSTCYEWLWAGRPAAVAVIADNQRPIATWLERHRAALVLPARPAAWSQAIASWLRGDCPRPAARIVDAHGALRVVDALHAISASRAVDVMCHD